jgi:tripartite-type tricarboxylate transporter receptor subunit TctC
MSAAAQRSPHPSTLAPRQRRRLPTAVAAGLVLAAAGVQAAENYPNRPVRLVNPYTPGGTVDFVSRTTATRLTEYWGQQVIVDNRPGAGTNIGTEIVVRAQPDGYTMLSNTGTIATNPSFYPKLPFNPVRDLSAMIIIVQTPNVIAMHPAVAVRSVKELIDLARSKPGALTFASSGTGSSTHLAMELFRAMAKLEFTHIPYKGGGPALTDVMGGQVNGIFNPPGSVMPQVKAGRLRALGVTSAKRAEWAPDLPAAAEAGLPGYEANVWFGVFAPKATPRAIVAKWNADINRLLKDPETRERFVGAYYTPVGGTPQEADAYFALETKRWSELIRSAKISAE